MYLRVHCKEQYTVQLQGHMVQISVRSSGNIFVILNSVKELKVSELSSIPGRNTQGNFSRDLFGQHNWKPWFKNVHAAHPLNWLKWKRH